MKENRYIEKFKGKSKHELEYKLANPSLFDPESIVAAKYILENYANYQSEKLTVEKLVEEPSVYKEMAVFKNKWVYRAGLFFTCILTLSYAINFGVHTSYEYLIWTVINGLFFLTLLSKHKETPLFLNILSTMSLLVMYYYYLEIYLNLNESQELIISLRDIKSMGIYLFLIFGGELVLEVRDVEVNRKA